MPPASGTCGNSKVTCSSGFKCKSCEIVQSAVWSVPDRHHEATSSPKCLVRPRLVWKNECLPSTDIFTSHYIYISLFLRKGEKKGTPKTKSGQCTYELDLSSCFSSCGWWFCRMTKMLFSQRSSIWRQAAVLLFSCLLIQKAILTYKITLGQLNGLGRCSG